MLSTAVNRQAPGAVCCRDTSVQTLEGHCSLNYDKQERQMSAGSVPVLLRSHRALQQPA